MKQSSGLRPSTVPRAARPWTWHLFRKSASNSCHKVSSGKVSHTTDQASLTQPPERCPSNCATRESAQRNCALYRFGAQSYDLRMGGEDAAWSKPGSWNQAAKRPSELPPKGAAQLPPPCDEATCKQDAALLLAVAGTCPSEASASTAPSRRAAAANNASWGLSNSSSEEAHSRKGAASRFTISRISTRPNFSSCCASCRRWKAADALGLLLFLSGCNARDNWR
mmetsp:Transcript_126264/g.404149  ORF Transcript_126264/g.404149 Transcript_126264/m.404149 type:complete len:224 (-) Transcript_126264:837-1508(-)